MDDSDGILDEDRRALWQEIRQTDERIRELNSSERENLMLETVKNLGFNGGGMLWKWWRRFKKSLKIRIVDFAQWDDLGNRIVVNAKIRRLLMPNF